MLNPYTIVLTRTARKDLGRIDAQVTRKVAAAIDGLMLDPRPPGCIKIKSEDGVWRIRVGDYRVGYSIDDATQVVTILRVGHRSDFYSN